MSISTEEYLEALYTLARESQPVTTSAVSKRLNIAPPSVTQMMHKLAAKKYIKYSPYQGVALTAQGYRMAEKITRKHRLLERFLHDVLKINKGRVHKEACAMEHALSDEAACAMCRVLKSPDHCPDDGQLIPACDLAFSSCEECRNWGQRDLKEINRRKGQVISVLDLKENENGRISFLRGDSKLLRRLFDLGLTPGARIKVNRISTSDGSLEVLCRGSLIVAGDDIARNVFVEKSPGPVEHDP